jgi:hypothetical protein
LVLDQVQVALAWQAVDLRVDPAESKLTEILRHTQATEWVAV